MLNRIESKIMDLLFKKCSGRRTILISPREILDALAPKNELTVKQLDKHMKNLVLDGYADYSNSDDNGNLVYVVTLTTRGEAFRREHADRVARRWRDIGWKIVLAVVAVLVGAILTKVLGL